MPSDRALLSCKPLGACRVVRASGREAMNELPSWEITALVEHPDLDFDGILGQRAVLKFVDEHKDHERLADLIVTAVAYESEVSDGHVIFLELSASAWQLGLKGGYRIFQNKTTRAIVDEIFADNALPAVKWHLDGTYFERISCTQYGESDWAFITRLLADEGISYWFDFLDDEGAFVCADHPQAHAGIEGPDVVPFEDPGGAAHRGAQVFHFEMWHGWTHDRAQVRAFDVDKPEMPIEGKAGAGPFEWYDYPTDARTTEAAGIRATTRLEQLQRLAVHARAESDCVAMAPGRTFKMRGAADPEHDGEFLIVGAEHHVQNPAWSAQIEGKPYKNKLLVVPLSDVAHRPPPPTTAPRVEGLETATTKGPSGEEIHVDALGRIKIEMRWDRAGIPDDQSSRWVRCVQMNLGGAMILPRVGWEVAIAFEHGDPDRPFSLGRLYHGKAPVPYALPGAKASTALKSDTTPGGGSVNEICLADDAGAQGFTVAASRDLSLQVGNDAHWKVTANHMHDVTLGHETTVLGDLSKSIGVSLIVTTEKHFRLWVNGARTNLVGGADMIHVGTDRKLGVETSYIELVGAFYGIQCNQENTAVMGAFTQVVGGVLAQTAGLSFGESVTGVRRESVGGMRVITTKLGVSEGGKFCTSTTLKAGAATETAAATIELKAKGKTSITSASASYKGEEIVIQCKELLIKASTIEIEEGSKLEIGGEVKQEGGKCTVTGEIKKQSGSKVEGS